MGEEGRDKTIPSLTVTKGVSYPIVIGGSGGNTSALGQATSGSGASGGNGGARGESEYNVNGGKGGTGGSGIAIMRKHKEVAA